METSISEIIINGKAYVEKGAASVAAPLKDGMKYAIVRCQGAGAFAGFVQSLENKTAVIRQSRRLWYWSGAASLSQLAVDGTCKPNDCKFPVAIDEHTVNDVLEVIICTDKAKKSIEAVKLWEQK